MPVKRNRLGPREARCEEVQRCKRRGAAGFHVQVIARTPEVRLGVPKPSSLIRRRVCALLRMCLWCGLHSTLGCACAQARAVQGCSGYCCGAVCSHMPQYAYASA